MKGCPEVISKLIGFSGLQPCPAFVAFILFRYCILTPFLNYPDFLVPLICVKGIADESLLQKTTAVHLESMFSGAFLICLRIIYVCVVQGEACPNVHLSSRQIQVKDIQPRMDV